MAQTRTGYVAIDDTQVDAESPITESLMTALRDQWYAALSDAASSAPATDRVQLPERAKCDAGDGNQVLHRNPLGGTPIFKNVDAASLSTTEINTSLRLQPNGLGGVAWGSNIVGNSGANTGTLGAFDPVDTVWYNLCVIDCIGIGNSSGAGRASFEGEINHATTNDARIVVQANRSQGSLTWFGSLVQTQPNTSGGSSGKWYNSKLYYFTNSSQWTVGARNYRIANSGNDQIILQFQEVSDLGAISSTNFAGECQSFR